MSKMDWHEKYFEMLYLYVRKQNERLLHEIAVREDIPYPVLQKLLPSQAALRSFLRNRQNDTEHLSHGAARSLANVEPRQLDNHQ